MKDTHPESWRTVPEYAGFYEVSDRGRVRSLDHLDDHGQRRTGRILRSRSLPYGHQQVCLSSHGKVSRFLVHRLVLMSFVGPAPVGTVACHNDGNPTNNALSNLRWDTQSENNRDAVHHGTHYQSSKTHCKRSHPLEAPNLVPSVAIRGHRSCRACAQAYSQARRDGICVTQELADERYLNIIQKGSPMTNPAPELSAHEQAEVDRFGIHEEHIHLAAIIHEHFNACRGRGGVSPSKLSDVILGAGYQRAGE